MSEWDSKDTEKEAGNFMLHASKIKEKEWKAMTGTLGALKEIITTGGLEGMLDRLEARWTLQVENALAPLTNEVTQLVADALAPILPMIVATLAEVTNYFTLGMGALEAGLTGTWDEWIREQTISFQKGMAGWSEDWIKFHTDVQILMRGLERYWETWVNSQNMTRQSQTQTLATWQNQIQQGWYDFWSALGW